MSEELQLTRMNISSAEDKLMQLREQMEKSEDDTEYEKMEEEYERLEIYVLSMKSKLQNIEVKLKKQ